jgi:hypothetical protein
MKTPKEFTQLACQHSKMIRILGRSCLITGLLTLAGCSYLETVTSQAAPDDPIQLGWQDGALSLRRGEIRDYTCTDGRMLQCVLEGVKYSCGCPRY